MKQIFMSFLLATLFAISAGAQSNPSGVYLSGQDFEDNKLSYTSNPGSETKITFNEFLGKPYITIKQDGEKTTLFKDEIFAYQKKGKIVRNSNFVSYTFLEKGAIWMYFREVFASKGKGTRTERKYYYSVSDKDEIVPLTISNLKKSFPDKQIFHNFLDAQFRRDADLSAYDSFNKKFKVNRLLQTTLFANCNLCFGEGPASSVRYVD